MTRRIYKSENGGPWSRRRPANGQGSGGQPDFEEWIRQMQSRINRFMGGGDSSRMAFVLVPLLLLAVWLASGIYRVLPDEQGVVTRFGAFHRTSIPGLHYHLPQPIEDVQKPKVTIINREDIGLRVFSGSRGFGQQRSGEQVRDVPEESLMLTGDENIIDVDFSIFWVINSAQDFLFNIQNPVGTVKVVAESAMREIVGKNKLQPILTEDRQRIEEDVKILLQKTLDEYGSGILVTQVKMQKVDPPATVVDSFRDVQAARADQERVRNEAQAYHNRVVPESRGEAARMRREAEAYREQAVAEAEGEALRFLAVYNEYRAAPDVTRKRLFLETMERVLENANKIVIDQKNNPNVVPYLPLDLLQRNQEKKQ